MGNKYSVDYHPCRSRLASRRHLFVFLQTPQSFILFSRMPIEVSLPQLGKFFQILVFLFLENAFNLGIFTYAPLPSQSSPPSSYHQSPRQRRIRRSHKENFLKIYFPQQQKGVKKTMICFIRIQTENMKMTWNISLFIFCMIFNFFKCDGFTVL